MSSYRRNFTGLSSFLSIKKEKPKTDLEKGCQYSISIEICLLIKVCFSLKTWKINNQIALCLTNQIFDAHFYFSPF